PNNSLQADVPVGLRPELKRHDQTGDINEVSNGRMGYMYFGHFILVIDAIFNGRQGSSEYIYILSFFVFSVFLTSFHNVFTRRQELHLWPQFGKMLLAMYVCIIGFAAHYLHLGIMYSGDIVHEPAASLYFSVVTWTTLGYGDFQPAEAVRGLAASQVLLGTLFMPLLLAAFISVIQDKSGDNKKL
ncbi:potassium channel family protein, partial [Alcanivorax sp. 1008]|uniref:potassium channel family protein n=1 Tax=Alcanivorax sp. 1008 TaxID=2816853 RepID=UPI001DDB9DEC